MATEPEAWHGWSRWDASRQLHIGPLPGRKSICFYTVAGSVMHVHAYFRSELEAHRAKETMDWLMWGRTPPKEDDNAKV